jgi:hypothetical protein
MSGLKRDGTKNIITAAFLMLAALLLTPAAARAQWTTTGNDVSNTNTGNVGVGTGASAPAAKLDVRGSVAVDGAVPATHVSTYPALWMKNSVSLIPESASGYSILNVGTNYQRNSGGWTYVSQSMPTWVLSMGGGPAWDQFQVTRSSGSTYNPVKLLVVTSAGNVGVGMGTLTPTPANALHVNSDFAPQAMRVSGMGGGIVNFVDKNAGANQKLYQWRSEGGLFRMSLSNDSELTLAQQNILVANSSGNVGVGTAAPLQRLQIGGNTPVGTTTPDAISLGATYSSGARQNPKLRLWDNGDPAYVYGLGVSEAQFDFMTPPATRYVWSVGGAEKMRLDDAGNVTMAGSISAKYQDVAEWVPSSQKLQAGTVVVLDKNEINHILASTRAYDTKVAGVVSAQPGVILGTGGEGKLKVATTGRVKVKVDATRAPVEVGDLLVTSDVEGVAMKSVEVDLGGVKIHRPGTIIGKALEPLASGKGEILVLLSLQ